MIHEIVELVRRKGAVPISFFVLKYNLSYHYFKYTIVKLIMQLHDDIIVTKKGDKEYLVSILSSEDVRGGGRE